MKIIPLVITSFAKYMTSGEAFSRMKDSVDVAARLDGTGPEKREAALNIFRAFGFDMADWLSNLLLELAVAWVKQSER